MGCCNVSLIPVLVVAMFHSEGVSGYESADCCVGCCAVSLIPVLVVAMFP